MAPQVSRREDYQARGIAIEMPPLEWGDYLIGYLFEFGPTMAAGMGSGPLTGAEILAWQKLLGIEFDPWEARLLRRLSNEYVSESYLATKRDRPAPYGAPPVLKKVAAREVDRNLDFFLA
ncbi:MAG: hypothetical protein RR376_08035 [Janthinobacterium sp.]